MTTIGIYRAVTTNTAILPGFLSRLFYSGVVNDSQRLPEMTGRGAGGAKEIVSKEHFHFRGRIYPLGDAG